MFHSCRLLGESCIHTRSFQRGNAAGRRVATASYKKTAVVFNFRLGRLSRLLSVSGVPMATASTTASAAAAAAGADVRRLVRLVDVRDRRQVVGGGRRATLVRADRLRLVVVVVGVGLAARDNRSSDRDMDRAAPADGVRVDRRGPDGVDGEATARRRRRRRRPHGLLPARVGVERELSGRRALGKVPRTGRRRRRVSIARENIDAAAAAGTGAC